LPRPRNWADRVAEAIPDAERARIKDSFKRGRPFGDDRWTRDTARRLDLEFTLNRRGRPKTRREK
jgi:hypothetical protein